MKSFLSSFLGWSMAVSMLGAFIAPAFGEPASSLAPSFTYQGRLLNENGTDPLTDVVDFTLSIYDPSGTCLLYEESQTGIDLDSSNGLFSLAVGSGLAPSADAAKRTTQDPGKSMAALFSNGSEIRALGAPNCAAGYTPNAGHGRKLRVTITPQTGSPTTLSPDLEINSVPQAQVAEKLQGLDASRFVQITGNSSSYTVAKSAVDALLGTEGLTDASSLHQHDSLYAKVSGSSFVALASGGYLGLGVHASPPSTTGWDATQTGRTWFDSSSNEIKYWDGSAVKTLGTSGAGVTSFNTRTGAVTLNSSDVTTALGFTPQNASDVTTDSRGSLSETANNPVKYSVTSGSFYLQSGTSAGDTLQWNGTQWSVGVDARHWQSDGTHVYRASGNVGIGTTSPEFKLSLDNDGAIIAKGTVNSGATLATTGAGARMIWYPKKAAFRAGQIQTFTTSWNDASIGTASFATNIDTTASGSYSSAFGYGSTASGWGSAAFGEYATASGMVSLAIGEQCTASGSWTLAGGKYSQATGSYSTALGYGSTSQPYASFAVGRYNVVSGTQGSWVSSDPLFVIGNGADSSNRSNAVTVLKNGNVGIGTTSPARLLHVNGPMRVTASALPGSPAAGDIAVDAGDSNKLKWHDGSNWQTAGGLAGAVDITGTSYTITSAQNGYYFTYNGTTAGTINLPTISALSDGFQITILRQVPQALTLTPNGADSFPSGITTVEMLGQNMQSVTLMKLGSKWNITNKTDDCIVGQSCWATNHIYAGIIDGHQYFTTPGGCTNSGTPTCTGTLDSQTYSWAANDGRTPTAYNISATAPDDPLYGAVQSATLATSYADTDAAKYCENMSYAGYTDWYLPARQELSLLYQNSPTIRGFSYSSFYWSSTESGTTNASYFNFSGGNVSGANKTTGYLVRCVRRF